jgi:adenosyl cobinamide kinase/adenosyl cobinamide phosphate guanylyltransferase
MVSILRWKLTHTYIDIQTTLYKVQTVQNSVLADYVTHMVTKNNVLHYFALYIALFVECSLNIDEYR